MLYTTTELPAAATTLLNDELLTDIGCVLADNTGVIPCDREALLLLLTLDPGVVFEAAEWGADDTDVRGNISDLVVRALGLGSRWPEYRDNIDIDVFGATVKAAAREAGWYVVSDSGPWPGL